MLKRTDIEIVVNDFKVKSNPEDRYTSFDYCYNYFRTTTDLTKDMEKSCLVLGFYLASWGMFRGSSFLLQHSVKHFQPTIEYIDTLNKSTWDIDVDNYTEENIEAIIEIYREIKKRLIYKENSDLTLITKILLGVFGFIPAFDSYFCDSFRAIADGQCGFRKVNKVSLGFVNAFYQENRMIIDTLSSQTFTTDFSTGKETAINYPKAKIIDMYGFNLAQYGSSEKVFEVLAEGGAISIIRHKGKSGEKFIYYHNESDVSNEGLGINETSEFESFDQPFQLINKKYPWYMLQLDTLHHDYKNYLIEKFLDKLNQKSVSPELLEHNKEHWEDSLQIKLYYHTNNWTYERIN